MKKLLVVMILSLSAATTTAYADTGSDNLPGWLQDLETYLSGLGGDMSGWLTQLQAYLGSLGANGSGHGGTPMGAPEIDPASVGSALTLLGCGLAMVRGRRAKK